MVLHKQCYPAGAFFSLNHSPSSWLSNQAITTATR
nr:MAG TPA: hypothetical protein [Herelleviridae sp.]